MSSRGIKKKVHNLSLENPKFMSFNGLVLRKEFPNDVLYSKINHLMIHIPVLYIPINSSLTLHSSVLKLTIEVSKVR